MCSTLTLDADVLAAAKVLARRQAQRNGLPLLPFNLAERRWIWSW